MTIENVDRSRSPSRIIRRVGFSENVDGIAGLKVAPGEGHIGIEREIGDRERADRVKCPDCDAFHRLCGGSCSRRGFPFRTSLLVAEIAKGHTTSERQRSARGSGTLTSASKIASSSRSIARYCPCQ